jgi:hypothetical protein
MILNKRSIWLVALFTLVMLVAVSLLTQQTASAEVVTEQSYKPATLNSSQNVGKISNVGYSVYQTFTANQKGLLQSVEFYKVGEVGSTGLGNLKVEIVQTNSTVPTNITLASATLPKSIANGWNVATFDSALNISKNTRYAIKFSCTTCANGSYYKLGDHQVAFASTSGYTSGSLWKKRTNNVNFFNSPQNDLGFATIVDVPSVNAKLSDLKISQVELTPAFDENQNTYSVTVPFTQSMITVKPTVADTLAQVKVLGETVVSGTFSEAIPLNVGMNTIDVVVTAEDTEIMNTYTIELNREEASTESGLASLSSSAGELTPIFSSENLDYDVTVPYGTDEVTLNFEAKHSYATIDVNGESNAPIALVVGDNSLEIVVTAQDGFTSTTYTINVFREPAQITVAEPVNYSILANKKPLFTGKAYPGATLNVSVLGQINEQVTADENGNWVYQVESNLPEGELELEVTDIAFPTNQVSSSFTVDTTGPSVSYEFVTNKTGEWYNQPVLISITCEDEYSTVSSCPESLTFDQSGENQAKEIIAIDALGNQSTIVIDDIDVDLDGPTINY